MTSLYTDHMTHSIMWGALVWRMWSVKIQGNDISIGNYGSRVTVKPLALLLPSPSLPFFPLHPLCAQT